MLCVFIFATQTIILFSFEHFSVNCYFARIHRQIRLIVYYNKQNLLKNLLMHHNHHIRIDTIEWSVICLDIVRREPTYFVETSLQFMRHIY